MRIAIFSDIHGNLEALEAFIINAAGRKVDHYFCLGDIVGYGANPNDCFDRLEGLQHLRILLGNHDACAIYKGSPYEMSPNASKAILWTIEQLSRRHTNRIKGLDELIQLEDMVFCHANPFNPTGWRYVITWFDAMRAFLASRGRLIFVGHTHRPKLMAQKASCKIKMVDPLEGDSIELNRACRYIINCGSIGQPRDGNPKAGYIIFDTQDQNVEFVRFAYDVEGAARRIRAAGLPHHLADRLFSGR